MARLEESGLRRLELCRVGFAFDGRRALWRRRDGIHLSEEGVDRLEPWACYVAWWRRTRPGHREESPRGVSGGGGRSPSHVPPRPGADFS